MLAIGSWIAGHQVPTAGDGTSNYAIPNRVNGILGWQRPSTAGGGIAPGGLVVGTMPASYAGEDMSISACWALGSSAAVNFSVGSYWWRFPSGGATSNPPAGPFGLSLGSESRAQPANSVQYVTFGLPGATIGALANEKFQLSFGMSVTDGVSGIEVYYLSLLLWVP